jgi:excisionase family DNA binding protein
MVAALPTEFSITELAALLRLPREKIRRRCEKGIIPSTKVGTGPTSKRTITMAAVRREARWLYDAIMLKWQETGLDTDDED